MTINKHWLLTGAAVVAALGIGFGAAQFLNHPTASETEHADDDHEEEDGGHGQDMRPGRFTVEGDRRPVRGEVSGHAGMRRMTASACAGRTTLGTP